MRVHLHAFARLTVLALCALLGGASLGAAVGHWTESDNGAPRIVRSHSPKYGPVATVAIPPPAVTPPVVVAAVVAPKPAPVAAPVQAVAPPKMPPPSGPVMPVSLRAPAPERFERSPGGEALAAWRRYAVVVDVAPGTPVIAIVIDDVGLDQNRSMRAVALKAPLTLAYLPYARDLAAQATAAHAAGHEILVHQPMEPQGHENPGPNALTIGMLAGEITIRVSESLDRVPFAVGLNNHMGSRFTRDSGALRPVMAELKRRGMVFLDSRTAPDSVGTVVARVHRVPYAERDVFLDNDASAPAVQARLAETEMIARRTGAAVAIGHPHEGTLDALETWLDTVEQRGFALVPITTIVARREARMAVQVKVETMTRRP
jgi:hypothetical protein